MNDPISARIKAALDSYDTRLKTLELDLARAQHQIKGLQDALLRIERRQAEAGKEWTGLRI